jgi:hypothetical protein
MFVVQLLNIRDEWARLREFDDFDETVAYLKDLKVHDNVTDGIGSTIATSTSTTLPQVPAPNVGRRSWGHPADRKAG